MAEQPTRVILVGIGGATSCGKTTLAKHLRRCVTNGILIHQDVRFFVPNSGPPDRIPIHPVHNVQDWDDPSGAIDWPRLVDALAHVKKMGSLPEGHYSHDHMNVQKEVPVEMDEVEGWKEAFAVAEANFRARTGERVIWAILDGFLLYWDQAVIDAMDVRILLRTPQEILKERREQRHGYHVAVQSDCADGSFWRDPPNYWDQIVWPAYKRAHEGVFESGDVENGKLNGNIARLHLLEGDEMEMGEMLNATCRAALDALEAQQ
ncbi:hypothetical protein BOTBODRAFT_121444 [Botryobasidium botryosum FD-172 SS1]|uniref:Phosphoribulokinase/uridine kinase domain-containing protein n=1 Tax=Botryobasidium botryosum (strain FD-172 SS1) TaxID=930990 RepID=A0A067LTR9_BOTB1|nr:hypothetical protein BOTBODRAFT_121444 [Botryobasidium botryosum FD-172 SS1]